MLSSLSPYGLVELPFWGYALVAFGLIQLMFLGITLYLHRDQSHGGLVLHPALRHVFRFWLWFSSGTVTRQWVAVHRRHHAYADRTEHLIGRKRLRHCHRCDTTCQHERCKKTNRTTYPPNARAKAQHARATPTPRC